MKQQYLKNVASLSLDEEKCIGCGICLEVCPHHVFKMDSGKIQLKNPDQCMECGACARNCPAEAISVRAGVGCAAAIIFSKLGGGVPGCGCSGGNNPSGCE